MWWIIHIVGLMVSWHFTDIESDSSFQSLVCPFFVVVFLIGLLIKVVFAMGPGSGGGGHGGGGAGGGYFDGFGGDGGGGE